jgi:flavin-dependent dehydrogenase
MRNSHFVEKNSVQFVGHSGRESEPFYFREHDDRPSSTTWQVERAEFDKMMWDRAAELGAECHDRMRVLEVLFDDQQRATGVKLQDSEGKTHEVNCRVVIDGSGQQSLIANRLSLKEVNSNLKKSAIWAYWQNARRDEGENAGATIIMHTQSKDSWFWFIPLSGGLTSIGCVGDHEYMLKRPGTTAETYTEELRQCAGLTPRLQEAKQVGKLHVAKEFSYSTKQHAGQGWVLVGDAFGFIDPIYSSGVYFALVTGERAGDAVVAGLRSGNLSPEVLGAWTEEFKRGMTLIRKLVEAYYNKSFSFGMFLKDHMEHRGNLVDLLIGRIFHREAGRIFEDMDPMLARLASEQVEA